MARASITSLRFSMSCTALSGIPGHLLTSSMNAQMSRGSGSPLQSQKDAYLSFDHPNVSELYVTLHLSDSQSVEGSNLAHRKCASSSYAHASVPTSLYKSDSVGLDRGKSVHSDMLQYEPKHLNSVCSIGDHERLNFE